MGEITNTIIDLLPMIMAVVVALFAGVLVFMKKAGTFKKEIAEALTVTGETVDKLATFFDIIAKSLEDGKLTKEEIADMKAQLKKIHAKMASFRSEWLDVYNAGKKLFVKEKK